MRVTLLSLLLLAGCGEKEPSLALTDGEVVEIDGCPFTIKTPAETTEVVKDDGHVGMLPTPRNLHLAYVGDPKTSISVTWATDVTTRGTTLEWGPDINYGHKTKGFWFAYPTDLAGADLPSVGMHQVHLCGLQPGTTYHYRVGTGAYVSADATFTTAPADGRPVRVLVAGDSRGNSATWGQVMQAGAADAPDVAIFTGDANDLGSIQDDWEAWFAAAAEVLPHLPLMMVHGNHEINSRHYYSQFPLPGNQQWYSFDFGAAHFTALNDTPPSSDPNSIATTQAAFLDGDLKVTAQPWKLVTHHRPEYTSSTGHAPAADLQMAWESILDANHVDMVLNGHAHAYERSFPLTAGQVVADGQGPVYVVEGGGGADPYDVAPQAFTCFAKQTFGYVILDITSQKLTMTAKDLSGGVIDTYSITK
jgi:calcineurin-like phosphoesterase family protein/purple acid phosphatase-like protein/iron/zinc purple acid phosphatase-like protein C